MFGKLRKIISVKDFKKAFLLAVISSLIIALIAAIDLKFDFASRGFEKATDEMKFAFYMLTIYIFIKTFTFFKKFAFWALALFTLIFMIDFYLTLNLITGFDGTYKELSEATMYTTLILLNFLYIFILNLFPDTIFNSRK